MGNCLSPPDNSVSASNDDSDFVFEGDADDVDEAPTYGVIYSVTCSKCKMIYIGEAENAINSCPFLCLVVPTRAHVCGSCGRSERRRVGNGCWGAFMYRGAR